MMKTLNELMVKALSLKTRVTNFGAPLGNKNAAGPHDGTHSSSRTKYDDKFTPAHEKFMRSVGERDARKYGGGKIKAARFLNALKMNYKDQRFLDAAMQGFLSVK